MRRLLDVQLQKRRQHGLGQQPGKVVAKGFAHHKKHQMRCRRKPMDFMSYDRFEAALILIADVDFTPWIRSFGLHTSRSCG